MSRVSGIHHVAIGVNDLGSMMAFYRDLMGFTEVFAEFGESEQEIMREVTRSSRAVFYGATIQQKAGGVMLEFIRMVEPSPRPIRRSARYGDVGVAKITLTTVDVPAVWTALRDRVAFFFAEDHRDPRRGEYQFVYCRDPEGNLGRSGRQRQTLGRCSGARVPQE